MYPMKRRVLLVSVTTLLLCVGGGLAVLLATGELAYPKSIKAPMHRVYVDIHTAFPKNKPLGYPPAKERTLIVRLTRGAKRAQKVVSTWHPHGQKLLAVRLDANFALRSVLCITRDIKTLGYRIEVTHPSSAQKTAEQDYVGCAMTLATTRLGGSANDEDTISTSSALN